MFVHCGAADGQLPPQRGAGYEVAVIQAAQQLRACSAPGLHCPIVAVQDRPARIKKAG